MEDALSVELTILVGTMTGTAELVAEDVGDALTEMGHTVEVEPMDDLDGSAIDPSKTYLICTSTYGQGDVPDNAMKMFEDLKANKPDLAGTKYGVISLGDRTYADTFCFGGKQFDEVLRELGAERVGEVFQHDASSGTIPEEEAAEWAKEWIGNFSNPRAAAA